jgi:CheY-like chemotaxis protein
MALVHSASIHSPHRVLVAAAEAENRRFYQNIAHATGHDVVDARDGREALVLAFARPLTLVITETFLPMLSGDALIEILRKDQLTAVVPILAIAPEPAAAERAHDRGADEVLTMPVAGEVILFRARALIECARMARKRAAAAPTRSAQIPDAENIVDGLCRRLASSKIHRRFMTTSPRLPPPVLLRCLSCRSVLNYEHSYVGGVSERYPEQWDYFVCAHGCGEFQYRHRTKKMRRVEHSLP